MVVFDYFCWKIGNILFVGETKLAIKMWFFQIEFTKRELPKFNRIVLVPTFKKELGYRGNSKLDL